MEVVCAQGGLSTMCNAVAGAPSVAGELCGNGLDDDCDGQTDEGFDVGSACHNGIAACMRGGVKVCTADGLTTLCNAVPAQPDVDGLTAKPNLTEQEARDMGVKERLAAAGLFEPFAHALERRDIPELERILRQIYLTPDDIQTVIAQMLGTSP